MKKVEVKSKDLQEKEVVVFVVSPTDADYRKAQSSTNKTFSDAIRNGALFRVKLDSYMREQGVWDDIKQKDLEEVQNKIREGIKKLLDKKKPLTLEEGKKLAIELRRNRLKQTRLLTIRGNLDEYTVEGQAENAKFDTLVSLCVKYENGENVFKNLDDYREKNTEPYAVEAASQLSSFVYNLDLDWEKKLPENQFLKKFGFVDDDLRLINEDGKYVDTEDRLMNKEGRYIDTDGNFIDTEGNRLDENGYLVVDFSHFEKKIDVVEDVLEKEE